MVLSMDRWKGKVAVVTGASAGSGAAIAEQLVANGLHVVGLARRKEKIIALSNQLKEKPGKLYAVKCDITKEDEILAAFKWVKDNLGVVHVLVNNAGIAKPLSLIDGNPSDWKEVVNTNVIGLSFATKLVVQDMISNKIDGHIIHISSVLGHYVAQVPDLNIYPASKFAVRALTETLRQDLNRMDSKIKISCVSPGPIDSEFHSANNLNTSPDWEEFYSQVPKLLGEDVADAVVYVLSTPPHVQVHDLMVRPIGEKV